MPPASPAQLGLRPARAVWPAGNDDLGPPASREPAAPVLPTLSVLIAERQLDALMGYCEKLGRDRPDGVRPAEVGGGAVRAVRDDVDAMHRWCGQLIAGILKGPLEETRRLNQLVRRWFSAVVVESGRSEIVLTVFPNPDSIAPGLPSSCAPTRVRYNAASWPHVDRAISRTRRSWTTAEVEQALRTWTRERGRPPRFNDWRRASARHPCASAVSARFGGRWEYALRAVGLAGV
jgi:hypothetical protein